MPFTKRRFVIPCREEECLKIYDLLKDKIPLVNQVLIEFTKSGILIEAYGYETDIKNLWYEVKKTTRSLREIERGIGLRRYSISLISRIIHDTFPPRLLVEALKKMHYSAEYSDEGDVIVSNADLETVVKTASKISELNKITSRRASNTSTRYFLISASTVTDLEVEKVVKKAIELGLLEEVDEGKVILRLDWRQALDILIRNIKKEHVS